MILFLLSSCVFEFHNTQPYHFLTENTCDFPCWMGITPGKTHYSEVEEILDHLVQTFAEQNITMTYEEKISVGANEYFHVFTPGGEIFVNIGPHELVEKIYVFFLNQPTIESFVENFWLPEKIGVCLAFRRASPVMIYEGMRVYPKAEIPDYDSEANTITIEDFYRKRVDFGVLEVEPRINHYQYTFDWEDMASTVVLDLTNPDPNADCKNTYSP